MFCSIIIPTVGRPSLAKSVESVLSQNFTQADFEIIIVNDSGQPLALEKWQESTKVHVITTQKRERCFARNTGASIATGDYFCFLDDDDWLLPNSLASFWSLTQQSPETAWFYGGVEFIDNEGKSLGHMNQGKTGNNFVEIMTETWIPIQASLVKADVFFETGGFNPEFIVTQDLDLVRRVALKYNFVNTPNVVTCIRRGTKRKSVTQYSFGWYYIALGRERLLANKNTLPRLLDGAGDSNILHGYALRNYIIATLFDLRQHQWTSALSRFIKGIICFLKSLKYTFSQDYWRALNQKHPLHIDLIENPSPDYESVEEWLYWS